MTAIAVSTPRRPRATRKDATAPRPAPEDADSARELVENCVTLSASQLLELHRRPVAPTPKRVGVRFRGRVFQVSLVPAKSFRGLWFIACPACDRRCRALYSARTFSLPDFRCRICWNLSYASQLR